MCRAKHTIHEGLWEIALPAIPFGYVWNLYNFGYFGVTALHTLTEECIIWQETTSYVEKQTGGFKWKP